jgi:MFS family permease
VTLFLGINSLVYYVIIGWLPSILQSMGYSEAQAGSLHGLLQLATAAPGLAIPLILHRLRDQRGIAVLVALMCAISAAGLWLLPGLAIGWTLLFGFGSGATMILGLTFIGLRASSAHQAAALSGMAQSVGYLLAACGPPLMGRIHDANGDWHIPLLAVALISLVMAVCGALAGRDREIHPEMTGGARCRWVYCAARNACTSGAGRPSSAWRSCWNKVATKNGCVTSSTARISPSSSQPVTRRSPCSSSPANALSTRTGSGSPLQCSPGHRRGQSAYSPAARRRRRSPPASS